MTDFHDNEVKHLEMIQSVITRMAQNSFLLKGWAMTLITALFALGLDKGSEIWLVTLLPLFSFWYLDAFFLKTERNYRELYNQTINKQVPIFCLKAPNVYGIKQTFLSQTLLMFYGALGILILLINCFILLK